jgi:hypothetical protein
MRAGLNLLLDGYLCARDLDRGRWEFAVEIAFLHAAGVINNDLRWLVSKGYAEYALDATVKREVLQATHSDGRLVLCSETCFVLTDAGVEFARSMLSAPGPIDAWFRPESQAKDGPAMQEERPYWDTETHTLYWRGLLVKHFKHEAPFQEAILKAFLACNWSQCVIVMLPKEEGVNQKERLREAIKNLNRNCGGILRFTQEGNGGRVAWKPFA